MAALKNAHLVMVLGLDATWIGTPNSLSQYYAYGDPKSTPFTWTLNTSMAIRNRKVRRRLLALPLIGDDHAQTRVTCGLFN
jgi:hypothetical protein